MKVKRMAIIFIIPITLLIICAFLTKQTLDYKSVNRELILQNDSLKGVVIDLNKIINEGNQNTDKTSLKKE